MRRGNDQASPTDSASSALRHLSPGCTSLHDHLARLVDDERRVRLGRHVEPVAIGDFCSRQRTTETLIVGGFVDGRLVASGELTGLCEIGARATDGLAVAELVVAVEPAYRSTGLGTRICAELIRQATLRRVALVRMNYHPDNLAMMRVANRFGATHYRKGDMLRAELCTGWFDETAVPVLIEDSPRFKPISMH